MYTMTTLLLSMLGFSTVVSGVPLDNLDKPNGRIIGGQNATDGAFPFMASVRTRVTGLHGCGGSIVSNRTIISAAHCLYRTTADNVFVQLGTDDASAQGERYQAVDLVIHPGFNLTTAQNDIALVIVDRDIEFTARIKPIDLSTEQIGGGVDGYVLGWGITSINGTPPDNLQFLNTKTISNDECRTRLDGSELIFNSTLCILNPVGVGVCSYDSGGPVVSNGKLIGIVSWLYVMCADEHPEVLTRIASYYNWINENKQ